MPPLSQRLLTAIDVCCDPRVGKVNSILRFSVLECRVKSDDDEFCSHVRRNRPSDDTAAGALKVAIAHQSHHPFIADGYLLIAKIRLNTRTTVGFGRCTMQRFDSIAQGDVRLTPFRGNALRPHSNPPSMVIGVWH